MYEIKKIVFLCMIFCVAFSAQAQENTSLELDNHIVYYNVFNSTLIPADVAKLEGLVRAKNQVYVNVAMVKKTGGNGIAMKVSGVRRNLMQQSFDLDFIEIKEAIATYYLAPIRFNNEEILHIDITVQPLDSEKTTTFTVTKKLYLD